MQAEEPEAVGEGPGPEGVREKRRPFHDGLGDDGPHAPEHLGPSAQEDIEKAAIQAYERGYLICFVQNFI